MEKGNGLEPAGEPQMPQQRILIWIFAKKPKKVDLTNLELLRAEVDRVGAGTIEFAAKIMRPDCPADKIAAGSISKDGVDTILVIVGGEQRQRGLAAAISRSRAVEALVISVVPRTLKNIYRDWRAPPAVGAPTLFARDLEGAIGAALLIFSTLNPLVSTQFV